MTTSKGTSTKVGIITNQNGVRTLKGGLPFAPPRWMTWHSLLPRECTIAASPWSLMDMNECPLEADCMASVATCIMDAHRHPLEQHYQYGTGCAKDTGEVERPHATGQVGWAVVWGGPQRFILSRNDTSSNSISNKYVWIEKHT